MVIVNPRATDQLSAETHHMNVDYSCFEGMELQGKIETVLSGGKVIVSDERFIGSKTHGRYLKRGRNALAV